MGNGLTFGPVLDNTGSVVVQHGTLSLQGGSMVGGTYLVQAGATLTFGSDVVTPTSLALPSDFTDGALDWVGTFGGTAQDNSGSGHKWRLIGDEPWRRAYVVYEEGAELRFTPANKEKTA